MIGAGLREARFLTPTGPETRGSDRARTSIVTESRRG